MSTPARLCLHMSIHVRTILTVHFNSCIHVDSLIQGRLLKLFVDAGDVDFMRILVNKYSVDVNGEKNLTSMKVVL